MLGRRLLANSARGFETAVQGVPTEPGGDVNATDIDSLRWALAVAFVETNTTNEVLAATKTVFPLSGMR